MKMMVSERALFTRMKRKLEKQDMLLKKHQPSSPWSASGRFYIVDLQNNLIERRSNDLEDWAREMNCLKDYEQLQQE